PMAWWSRYTLWLWGGGALGIGCAIELLLRAPQLAKTSTLLVLGWTLLSTGEAVWALAHVGGLHLAVRRYPQLTASGETQKPTFFESLDLEHALQNKKQPWIAPEFWQLGLTHDARVCRAEWKPKT